MNIYEHGKKLPREFNVMDKVHLKLCPEFTYELVLGVPYAYWLHKNGMLGSVTTSKGMKPYYWFAGYGD